MSQIRTAQGKDALEKVSKVLAGLFALSDGLFVAGAALFATTVTGAFEPRISSVGVGAILLAGFTNVTTAAVARRRLSVMRRADAQSARGSTRLTIALHAVDLALFVIGLGLILITEAYIAVGVGMAIVGAIISKLFDSKYRRVLSASSGLAVVLSRPAMCIGFVRV